MQTMFREGSSGTSVEAICRFAQGAVAQGNHWAGQALFRFGRKKTSTMLSDQAKQQFNDEGYLVFEQLISGEKLSYYVSVFDELVVRSRHIPVDTPHWSFEIDDSGQQVPGFLHKIQGVCVLDPRVVALAKEPAILARVAPLIGPAIDVFGTKFFPKLPGGGTSVHWHQDNFYFDTNTDRIVSCGVYLEDADREMDACGWFPKAINRKSSQHITGTLTPMAVGLKLMNRKPLMSKCRAVRLCYSRQTCCTAATKIAAIERATARHGITRPLTCRLSIFRAVNMRTGTLCSGRLKTVRSCRYSHSNSSAEENSLS